MALVCQYFENIWQYFLWQYFGNIFFDVQVGQKLWLLGTRGCVCVSRQQTDRLVLPQLAQVATPDQMYLSKLTYVFVFLAKYICPNRNICSFFVCAKYVYLPKLKMSLANNKQTGAAQDQKI